ncbi:MAG: ATP-binding cassette domain-containing protein [Deltaproteobacteria bacterium]|nr:ATP-binding cassette domain-containing protein [Deltaproteobacteria bacterium]
MIKIVNLRKSFAGYEVLRGVDLEIPRGKITSIIGQSGGGKTVLLKNLVGLMKPDSGEILVDGVDIAKLRGGRLDEVKKRFGMVFQGGALFDSLTVLENVTFPLRELTKQSEGEINSTALGLLKETGLAGMEGKYPDEISGGMKKRVALVRALVLRPEYMFFDEPTTGLDPIIENAMHALIKKCMAEVECTDVLVSHNINEVLKMSDRIAMLHEGVIIEAGTPEEIKTSENPFVRQFLSGSVEGPIQPY